MKGWQKTKKQWNSILCSSVFLKFNMNQKLLFFFFFIFLKVKISFKGVTVETGVYHVARRFPAHSHDWIKTSWVEQVSNWFLNTTIKDMNAKVNFLPGIQAVYDSQAGQ